MKPLTTMCIYSNDLLQLPSIHLAASTFVLLLHLFVSTSLLDNSWQTTTDSSQLWEGSPYLGKVDRKLGEVQHQFYYHCLNSTDLLVAI